MVKVKQTLYLYAYLHIRAQPGVFCKPISLFGFSKPFVFKYVVQHNVKTNQPIIKTLIGCKM